MLDGMWSIHTYIHTNANAPVDRRRLPLERVLIIDKAILLPLVPFPSLLHHRLQPHVAGVVLVPQLREERLCVLCGGKGGDGGID